MGRGRAPCCEKVGLNKGSWTKEEDMRLVAYIKKYGHGNWRALPKQAGLLRCGKSCRLRWINYLRPDIKRGNFTKDEEATIIKLHRLLGNKWSKIASCLPGRTDNEIKNVWNTHLKKRVSPSFPNVDEPEEDKIEIEMEVEPEPDIWGALLEAPSSSSSDSFATTACSEGADFLLPDVIPELLGNEESACVKGDSNIEGESMRWLAELEKDLELWGESDGPWVEMDGSDPVLSYFQDLPSSPWPLELLDLELPR